MLFQLFNFKTKLYIRHTQYFSKIATFKSNKGTFTIFKPDSEDNFYPIGHYGHLGKHMPEIAGVLVNGAVEKQIDYELIWDNKGSYTDNRYSIWKPIPSNGYMNLGVVVMPNYNKPSVNDSTFEEYMLPNI